MRKLLPALLLATLALTGCHHASTTTDFNSQLRAALRDNPELVFQALEQDTAELYTLVKDGANQQRMAKAEAKFVQKLENPTQLAISDNRPMQGNADAPVTVAAFTDFQCGYCARGAVIFKELLKQNPDSFRYVAKHAPMSETGKYSAQIFEALGLQSNKAAWEFYYQAFAGQKAIRATGMAEEMYLELASRIDGIDVDQLKKDIKSEAVAQNIVTDAREFTGHNFRGVPVYFIGGAPIEGTMTKEFFKKAINLASDAAQAKETHAAADEFTAEDIGSCLDCIEE